MQVEWRFYLQMFSTSVSQILSVRKEYLVFYSQKKVTFGTVLLQFQMQHFEV